MGVADVSASTAPAYSHPIGVSPAEVPYTGSVRSQIRDSLAKTSAEIEQFGKTEPGLDSIQPTGCSSARSERLVWDQEAPGSNPGTPTRDRMSRRYQQLSKDRRAVACTFFATVLAEPHQILVAPNDGPCLE